MRSPRRPGLPDAWYDGDTDCAGNDDYDQDEDFHVLFEYANSPPHAAPGAAGRRLRRPRDVGALSYPGAPDEWYDGVDTDCAGTTTTTRTVTSSSRPSTQASRRPGETALEGTGALPTDDCDTSVQMNPEGIEQVTDPTDIDCDGDPAAFPMGAIEDYGASIASLVWSGPDDLVFDANSDDIYLSLRTTEVEVTRFLGGSAGSPSSYYESAFAFAIDRDDPAGGVINIVDWWRFTKAPPRTPAPTATTSSQATTRCTGPSACSSTVGRCASPPTPSHRAPEGRHQPPRRRRRDLVCGLPHQHGHRQQRRRPRRRLRVHRLRPALPPRLAHPLEGNSLDEQELYEDLPVHL